VPSRRPEVSGPASDDRDAGTEEGGTRHRRRGGRGRGRHEADERTDAGKGEQAEQPGADEQHAAPPPKAPKGKGGGGRGKAKAAAGDDDGAVPEDGGHEGDSPEGEGTSSSSRRRRRRRRSKGESGDETTQSETGSRQRGRGAKTGSDEVTALRGSTRLEAKRQRRREGRDAGRRRATVSEAEFLARRESVERGMVVREAAGRVQIAVLEDGVLVEHYVSRAEQNSQAPMAGNVYLGRVQNVLPSMEAAFVDIGKGRNAVLYAGEVNWDAAGMEGQPRRIEQAMKSGDSVLAQVTKDPVGHKGARLTSQITLAGRYLVYVPGGGMTGISRKLPDTERARLKKILKEIVPDDAGVIVRTAAEGASDEELRRDVARLQEQWTAIEKKAKTATPPVLLQGEPDLAIRVVRDIFNDDFGSLVIQGDDAWETISGYVAAMAPDLADRVRRWEGDGDVFAAHRVDEQLAKGMDRKVWLPSGGSLVIDRTEAMTVIDVNTGKFTGSGGTLEETVTRNNLEAAEELVRQLRLRDIGGIIVIDFIDMVLESNRDLVLRRLVECLGRDRTKHQVAEVTSLGLVQMTRKRVGQGLIEAFSETCQHCNGRGFIVHSEPVDPRPNGETEASAGDGEPKRSRRKKASSSSSSVVVPVLPEAREAVKATLATIAAAAAHAHEHEHEREREHADGEAGATEPADAALADAEVAEVSAEGEQSEVVSPEEEPQGPPEG
jgi:ribonuclease E